MGALSCSSTSPGGYRAPGVAIHSLEWLSMALHTSLVGVWWGARGGTARRGRWHVKPVWTPVAIFGSLWVCIYEPAGRHGLISYSLIHLT